MFSRAFPGNTITVTQSATRFVTTDFLGVFYGDIRGLFDIAGFTFPADNIERVNVSVELDLLSEGHLITVTKAGRNASYAVNALLAANLYATLSIRYGNGRR